MDNVRIKALHISGLLVKTNITKFVSMHPVYYENGEMEKDVGDNITEFCRNNNLNYYVCRNTHNDIRCVSNMKDSCFKKINVDRALDDDNEVIYIHLGRGMEKQFGFYKKPDKVSFVDWVKIVKDIE